MFEILNCSSIDLEELKENLDENEYKIALEYFDFFIDEEFGFYTDQPERFPELDLSFSSPETINNCIIDIDTHSDHNIQKIADQLSFLGCKFLELRFFSSISISELRDEYLTAMNQTRLRNITVYMKYSEEWEHEASVEKLLRSFPLVGNLIVHSSPFEKSICSESPLSYQKTKITSEKCCGIISRKYHRYNQETFLESQQKNSCLNKKVSIDSSGEIRNCPSMPDSFGSHHVVLLTDVVQTKNFTKTWDITKDSIEVCKDCQFRYVCTDCRAYLENPENKNSKPLKCGYDPYNNLWEDWGQLAHKIKAMEQYEMDQNECSQRS